MIVTKCSATTCDINNSSIISTIVCYRYITGGGGGHVIEAPNGDDLAQRANLQFTGNVSVTDDSTNNRTVVNVTGGGGTFGNYQFRSVDAGITPGAQVGLAVTGSNVTIDASANIVHAVPFPAGLVDRTDYFFRVTGAVTGLAVGDDLAEFRENAFAGADIWFNIRPIVDGVAGDAVDFTTGGTFTDFGYTAFVEEAGTELQLLDTAPDPDANIFTVRADEVVDFTSTPTVNQGLLASDEEVRQVFDRLEYEIEHIDPFTPLPHEDGYVYTADSGVTGIQPENTLTGNACLLYTSPSPRDS